MSHNNFSSPPLAGDLPPMPPIVNTIVGRERPSAGRFAKFSQREKRPRCECIGDKYFESRSRIDFDVRDEFLGNSGNPDETEITPPSGRSLFTENDLGAAHIAGGGKDEVSVSRAIMADFPSEITKVHNRFSNQDEALNDEGYDSKGNLPYFANEDLIMNCQLVLMHQHPPHPQ